MSVSAQLGDFGFAIQPSKVGRTGTYTGSGYKWYRMDPLTVRMDIIQGDQVLPPEVSPDIVPKGAYKDGYFGAGQADLIPRLQNSFGALLWGLMGNASSVTGKDTDGVSATNVNTHIFSYNPSDKADQPWMSFRRLIPGKVAADRYGQTFFDAKVANARITIPQKGKLMARITMVARDVDQEENPTWVWDVDYEDTTSTPQSDQGYLKMQGTEFPITGAVFELDNGLTTPDQERIIGDPRPDDFTALYRPATLRFVYKWEDPSLYQQVFNGGDGLTDWDPLPKIFSTVGANFAFDAMFETPLTISGSSPARKYAVRIRGNSATLAPDGPIELASATLLQQAFTLTILKATGNAPYLQILLQNGVTGYSA